LTITRHGKARVANPDREVVSTVVAIPLKVAKDVIGVINVSKHHEWWNGKGYPMRLRGENIPLPCRMMAVADAFDAMTSERPYRLPLSLHEAVCELERCAGEQFDPKIVRVFINEVLQKSQLDFKKAGGKEIASEFVL